MHFIGLRLATPAAQSVGQGPAPREPARLRRFCRRRAGHCASSPERCRTAFLQVRLLGLGPRSRPRILSMRALLWAGRSLSTSATSFQCTTHEHESTSVVLARRRGLPCVRCHARCAFHAARTFLFRMQRRYELVAPQRATRDSPTLGLESRAPKARKPPPPRTTPFRWARRTWDTRRPKEPSKGERSPVSRPRPTLRGLRPEVPPPWLFRAPPVTGDACEMG